MVMTPKGNADAWALGLMEVVWKMVESVIDTRIETVVYFHDFLHGFRSGRGTGNAIMEIKLAQELASLDQYPLFRVLLDLRKAYENLDHGRLLQTLARCMLGPKL